MSIKLMAKRLGNTKLPPNYYLDTVENANSIAAHLKARGGYP